MKTIQTKCIAMITVALFSLSGLTTWAACSASPWLCFNTANVTVPAGGTCYTTMSTCSAVAVSFDANGSIYQAASDKCLDCTEL